MQRRFHLGFCLTILIVSTGVEEQVRGIEKTSGGAEAENHALAPESGLLLTISAEATGTSRRRPPSLRGTDPIRSRLVKGTLSQFHPQENAIPEGLPEWRWKRVAFDENGGVQERGYYLYAPVVLNESQVVVLSASGQSETYVNGQPRGGDVYNHGYVHLPVPLNAGTNHLLFRAGRGSFKVNLYAPPSPVFLHRKDTTLPDLVVGQKPETWGAINVINAAGGPAKGFTLTARAAGLREDPTPIPPLAPLTVRKVAFRLRGDVPARDERIEGTLELRTRDGRLCHTIPLILKAVAPDQRRRVTFVSEIDGSVQYFSLRPASPVSPDDPPPAIVLSCHGAAVQAHGQTGAYSSKRWFHIVAPTNRRPYGYDWEDFGRMDAMEVLEIACNSLDHDPSRLYVTGHSMGGHGAWHLGVTYPDRFAAVGPSAGWLSRSSYGRQRREDSDESAMDAIVRRCQTSGDTVALAANLKRHGIYILHGGDDDNVPASQAQRMAEVLDEFHHDWVYHEEPGKGHWWSNEYSDGGAACVDWPFMFDLFARHALPPSATVREVEFVTANPGVSSRCHWLTIAGQIRHLELSKAHVQTWPGKRLFQGTTENVAVLQLDVRHLHAKEPITVELDGQTLAEIPYPDETGSLWLRRADDRWHRTQEPVRGHKGPHRYGSIKDELKHRFLLVYGTQGTPEENAWAFRKARQDAETFWYRGNGSVPILRDSALEPSRYADRTVVLYGNAGTNLAWPVLLSGSPVQVRRGQVQIGSRTLRGNDLSAVFVQPRRDSEVASVVVVGGTGPVGMRLTYFVSFFTSFVRYPDCVISRPRSGNPGASENVAVGFFGLDWSVENGEFAFLDTTTPATP